MERLTDPAQGYCEMYCESYGMPGCGDPETCVRKNEVKMYEKLKDIEGIVPFDRLLELAFADRDGRCVVLPCDVGDIVYYIVHKNGERTVESAQVDGIFIEDEKAALDVSKGIVQFSLKEGEFFLTHADAETALKGEQNERA